MIEEGMQDNRTDLRLVCSRLSSSPDPRRRKDFQCMCHSIYLMWSEASAWLLRPRKRARAVRRKPIRRRRTKEQECIINPTLLCIPLLILNQTSPRLNYLPTCLHCRCIQVYHGFVCGFVSLGARLVCVLSLNRL